MNTMNQYVVQEYQTERMRQADHERLVAEVSHQSSGNALLVTLGRQMVKLGERLQSDSAQVVTVSRQLQTKS